MLTGVLPQQQPFREEDNLPDVTLVFLPHDDEEAFVWHRIEEALVKRGKKGDFKARELLGDPIPLDSAPGIVPWGEFDLKTLLVEQAESLDKPLSEIALGFSRVEVPTSGQGRGWRWHPLLGFTPRS
jgi:CRISPR-associated endonuclease/helicase Cas3